MDLSPITLAGRTIRLEPLGLQHLDGLVAVGMEPSLWVMTQSVVRTAGDMRTYVEQALADQRSGTALPFATVEQATGTIVGSTRFCAAAPEHRRVEIGWTWIAPRWQRSAVNTEAKYLMLRHAFDVMGTRRVELKTSALNTRSRNAMLRIGAVEEGTLRQHMIRPDGSSRDSVYFSILDGEWPTVRFNLEKKLTAY